MLDLLGVRYVIVPAAVPPGRPELPHRSQTYPAVYADKWVRIRENVDAFPRVWIVHEVRQVAEGEA